MHLTSSFFTLKKIVIIIVSHDVQFSQPFSRNRSLVRIHYFNTDRQTEILSPPITWLWSCTAVPLNSPPNQRKDTTVQHLTNWKASSHCVLFIHQANLKVLQWRWPQSCMEPATLTTSLGSLTSFLGAACLDSLSEAAHKIQKFLTNNCHESKEKCVQPADLQTITFGERALPLCVCVKPAIPQPLPLCMCICTSTIVFYCHCAKPTFNVPQPSSSTAIVPN